MGGTLDKFPTRNFHETTAISVAYDSNEPGPVARMNDTAPVMEMIQPETEGGNLRKTPFNTFSPPFVGAF